VPDSRDHFIELALRPLAGNPPAEDLARGELMERLNHARPAATDDSLESATQRLISAGAPRRAGLWAFLALLVSVAVLAAVAVASWRELVRLDVLYRILPWHPDHSAAVEAELAKGRDADQQLFLFANCSVMGAEVREAWRDRCAIALPDDPAWLEEYAAGARMEDRVVREKVLAQARRIDPGNGWWDLWEASLSLGRSRFNYLDSRPPGGRRGGLHGPALPPTAVTDEAFHEAVAWFERAASAPRLETRIPARTAERLALLGPAEDLAGLAERRFFAFCQQRFHSNTSRWAELWLARARLLEQSNDRDGLQRWFGTVERLMGRLLTEVDGWGPFEIHSLLLTRHASQFRDILIAQGLNDEADRLSGWIRAAHKYQSGFSSRAALDQAIRKVATCDDGFWCYGGVSGFVTDAELEPGRRAEHAMADRMLALSAAILFGLFAVLAGIEGWRRPLPVRGLASGLWPMLRPADFAWVGGLGIALPALWHGAVTGGTPLGGRDLTIRVWEMKPLALQAAGSFLFASCLLVQSARWRLAKRGGFLGFRPVLWPGWVMAAVAALFVPATGAVHYLPKWQEEYLNFGSAAAGLPLLWLLWRAFALILGPRGAALPGVLVCRMLVPAFLAAAAVLLAVTPLLKREEVKWITRTTLGVPDPAGSGWSAADARMAGWKRQRMLEAMYPGLPPAAK
jgi:hypothetical protein